MDKPRWGLGTSCKPAAAAGIEVLILAIAHDNLDLIRTYPSTFRNQPECIPFNLNFITTILPLATTSDKACLVHTTDNVAGNERETVPELRTIY